MISLYIIGIFALFMGISKVGIAGVIQSLKNNPDVVFSILLPLFGVIVLQLGYRLVLMKQRIELSNGQLTLRTVFSKKNIRQIDVSKITKVIRYSSFSIVLKIEDKNKNIKKLNVSIFKEKGIQTCIAFLLGHPQ